MGLLLFTSNVQIRSNKIPPCAWLMAVLFHYVWIMVTVRPLLFIYLFVLGLIRYGCPGRGGEGGVPWVIYRTRCSFKFNLSVYAMYTWCYPEGGVQFLQQPHATEPMSNVDTSAVSSDHSRCVWVVQDYNTLTRNHQNVRITFNTYTPEQSNITLYNLVIPF